MVDHCESCGEAEGRMSRLFDLHITVCVREYKRYQRNGPRTWEKADRCHSCGTTEERLVRHPDGVSHMTICNREDLYYRKYGKQSPKPTKRHWVIPIRPLVYNILLTCRSIPSSSTCYAPPSPASVPYMAAKPPHLPSGHPVHHAKFTHPPPEH